MDIDIIWCRTLGLKFKRFTPSKDPQIEDAKLSSTQCRIHIARWPKVRQKLHPTPQSLGRIGRSRLVT